MIKSALQLPLCDSERLREHLLWRTPIKARRVLMKDGVQREESGSEQTAVLTLNKAALKVWHQQEVQSGAPKTEEMPLPLIYLQISRWSSFFRGFFSSRWIVWSARPGGERFLPTQRGRRSGLTCWSSQGFAEGRCRRERAACKSSFKRQPIQF